MRDAVAAVDLASLAAGQERSDTLWRLDGEDLQVNLVRLGVGDRIQPHKTMRRMSWWWSCLAAAS